MQNNDIITAVDTLGSRAQQIFQQLFMRNMATMVSNRMSRTKFEQFMADISEIAAAANIVYPLMTQEDLREVWGRLRLKEELFVFLLETTAEFKYIFGTDANWNALVDTIGRASSNFVMDADLAKVDPDISSMLPRRDPLKKMLEENDWLVSLAMARWTLRSMDLTKTRLVFLPEEKDSEDGRPAN